ncbi:MAG: hypothetical protein ACJAQT_000254 [Akkermansiaceae bacterium]|jgi:hypothetical protein
MSYSYQSRPSFFNIAFAAILLIVLVTLISAQQFTKGRENNRRIAINNVKAIAGGLIVFKVEYGSYPCKATARTLKADQRKKLPAGKSANAYFAQLIVTESLDSEKYFYTPGIEGFQQGDDVKDSSKTLLAEGENGFAYVMTLNDEALSDIKSMTPIAIASVKVPGIVPTFDQEAYKGIAVYGAVDGSGKYAELNKHGNAISNGRVHLFQTGEDGLFGEDFPIVTFPKPVKKK